MILDSKQVQRSNFIMSHQKNGDLIVKFDDNETCHAQHRNVPNMHYIGKVVKLPTLEHGTHTIKYGNDQPCKIGDVVFFNGCHYVLAKSANYPFLEWVSLDTSEFESNKFDNLENRLQHVEEKIPNDGKNGQVLVINNNQAEWQYLSATSIYDDSVVTMGEMPNPPEEDPDAQPAKYIVGTSYDAQDGNKPQVYKTNIEINDVNSTIQTTSKLKKIIIEELDELNTTKTIGKMRDKLQDIQRLVNKLP